MKKRVIAIIIVFMLTPFIIRPGNIVALYTPLHDEPHLLITAIMPEPNDAELFELSWPTWFIRFLVSQNKFDFVDNYDANQSTLQLILAAVFDHEKNNSDLKDIKYVMSIAKLSLEQGALIDNVADYGLSALHEAILFDSISVTKFLVSNRADCGVLVSRPGTLIDGMTALELAEFLTVKINEDRSEIIGYLKSKECNKTRP